ncbi:hypothetical protein A6R68_09614, partial [Neotoma lepida]
MVIAYSLFSSLIVPGPSLRIFLSWNIPGPRWLQPNNNKNTDYLLIRFLIHGRLVETTTKHKGMTTLLNYNKNWRVCASMRYAKHKDYIFHAN